MMRKNAFYIALVCFIATVISTWSCSDKKPVQPIAQVSDTTAVDSLAADTMETIIEEQPIPKAADELFDDFVFNFAGSKKLQMERIKFPIDVYQAGKVVKKIEKKDWKIERFFMRQGYYTLIFDDAKQMDIVKDTAINHVIVEKIIFKNKTVKQYAFNRINGKWMMTSIGYKSFDETVNASFLNFYHDFSVDSVFQVKSMDELVTFTAPDPDDDFSSITGSITPEQWQFFKPELIPSGQIYNILYGQKYKAGTQKILVVRGIANGLETEMTFKKKNGRWKLTKFTS